MTPAAVETARAIVRLVMRDIVIPGTGALITFVHWPPPFYTLPILAGMMVVPLVGRSSGSPEPDDREPLQEGEG